MAEIRQGRGWSLRRKLVLITLLPLLAAGWWGARYLEGLERQLRQAEERTQTELGRVMAAVVAHSTLPLEIPPATAGGHLWAPRLATPPQLDGYADDWQPLQHQLPTHTLHNGTLRVAAHGTDLWLLLEVRDSHPNWCSPLPTASLKCDHLRLDLQTADGSLNVWRLATSAPGWIETHRRGGSPGFPFTIQGQWRETRGGYRVELRIIGGTAARALAVEAIDLEENRPTETPALLSLAIQPESWQRLLEPLLAPGQSLQLTDRNGRLLVRAGDATLSPRLLDESPGWLFGLYRLVTGMARSEVSPPPPRSVLTEWAGATPPAVVWRPIRESRLALLTSLHLLHNGEGEELRLVLARTGAQLLLLQETAMARLVGAGTVIYLLTVALLLAYATRLSWRVRRLRDAVSASISEQGQPLHTPPPLPKGKDELGDLGRAFDDLLERLRHYTRYLEVLASRLSHELRTPTAVVRSSLDNLETLPLPPEAGTYARRAREGVVRMERLVTRLGEARRLETALHSTPRRRLALDSLLRDLVEGYRMSHGEQRVVGKIVSPLPVVGAADLIAQMMDKLVENAIDFSPERSTVRIEAEQTDRNAVIRVINEGPPLPAEGPDLFGSLVSIRRREGAHLGLGLFVVRMIVEYHGGSLSARNLEQPTGVAFIVELPLPEERGQDPSNGRGATPHE
ncbi:MAG TPA: HAMP domain-containing protein [Thiotrichales bacterium]|nr:HAMP domain-containing protein [Thiotrichales bacterium]